MSAVADAGQPGPVRVVLPLPECALQESGGKLQIRGRRGRGMQAIGLAGDAASGLRSRWASGKAALNFLFPPRRARVILGQLGIARFDPGGCVCGQGANPLV